MMKNVEYFIWNIKKLIEIAQKRLKASGLHFYILS